MEEDVEFNRFVKAALESAEGLRAVRRHSWLRWSVPALLAASFALMAILRSTFLAPVDCVADTIELLSMTEDLSLEGATAADLLLAWQDAPFMELL